MPDALDYEFQMTPIVMREGINLTTLSLQGGSVWRQVPTQMAIAILSAGGAILLTILIWLALGWGAPASPWAMMLAALLGFYAVPLWIWRLTGRLAHRAATMRFNRDTQRIRLDRKGIVLANDVAEWRTSWKGVDAVEKGKKALVFIVS